MATTSYGLNGPTTQGLLPGQSAGTPYQQPSLWQALQGTIGGIVQQGVENSYPVVAPQPRQLGNAIPAQPGSLASLTNNPSAPQQLQTQSGILPSTGTTTHVQPTLHPTSVTTNSDGTVKTTYPSESSTPAPGASINGQQLPTAAETASVQTPAQIAAATGQTSSQSGSATNNTPTPSSIAATEAGLINNPSPQVLAANKALQDLQTQAAQAQAGTENVAGGAPITASDQAGQAGILNRLYAAKIAAAETGVQNALSSQGQGITALGQAGSQVAPIQVSPGNAVVSPTTMKEGYSGIGGLTGLSIAKQDLSQGNQYQQQSSDLSQNLGILKTTGNNVVSMLSSSGLSLTDNPTLNKAAIENWGKNVNPQGYTTYMAGAGELENTISGIIAGYTGQTPTAVSQTLDSMNFKYLSPSQLQGFLNNVDQLGQYRLNQYQQATTSSYDAAKNGTPYIGGSATGGGLTGGSNINTGTAAAGTALQLGGTLLGDALKALGASATNAVVGGAAMMFGS